MSAERLTAFFSTLQAELSNAYKEDTSVSFAIERQQVRARKKAVFPGHQKELSEQAVERFIALNEAVSNVHLDLDPDVVSNARYFILCILQNYTTSVRDHNVQVSLDLVHLFELWGFGPGASFGTKSTHPAEKMYSRWTCTPSAQDLVYRLRRNHPYLYLHDKVSGDINIDLVSGSKLATVPKNEERNRTIAIEPLGNMCLQLAAGRYLEGALRHIGLDIRTQQPKNKDAARLGSSTGRYCTLDLKDASDMFTPELVRLLLPDEWYELLMKIRSPYTILPNGQSIPLNMISTMGNGFTFPLMTMILVSLIYGTYCKFNRARSLFMDWNETCVFGDDIIIPSDMFEPIVSTIEAAGLIVNRDKSYFEGPFRESCGGDFHKGYDVTPFYVKSLNNNPEVYVALNQVLEWKARHSISLPHTLDLLLSYVDGPVFFVPEWSNPDSGVKTSRVSRRYKELKPVAGKRKFINDEFAMPLVAGGMLEVSFDGLNLFYSPRLYKTRYRVKKSRLPRGFLDGRDPLTRSPSVSHSIDLSLFVRDLGHS